MKKTIFAAALFAVATSSLPVLAQQPPGDQPKPTAPNVQDFDKQMAQAQDNMKKMREEMDKIRQTQDPQERQKLLQEHWTTMQNNMQLMHDMWMSGGAMGCCMDGMGMWDHDHDGSMMGWGHMGHYYSKLTPEQMKQRHYMMDRYMPMQQMMMDQMMHHEHYMQMR